MTSKLIQLKNNKIQEINEKLDLYIPGDVTDAYEQKLYEKLFYYIRLIQFDKDISISINPTKVFHNFYSLSIDGKENELTVIENLIEKSRSDNMAHEYIFAEDTLTTKIGIVYNALAREDKPAFLYYIDTGKIATESTNLSKYITEVNQMYISAEDQARDRLANVMDSRQRFDMRRMGRSLSPEDVENYIKPT